GGIGSRGRAAGARFARTTRRTGRPAKCTQEEVNGVRERAHESAPWLGWQGPSRSSCSAAAPLPTGERAGRTGGGQSFARTWEPRFAGESRRGNREKSARRSGRCPAGSQLARADDARSEFAAGPWGVEASVVVGPRLAEVALERLAAGRQPVAIVGVAL